MLKQSKATKMSSNFWFFERQEFGLIHFQSKVNTIDRSNKWLVVWIFPIDDVIGMAFSFFRRKTYTLLLTSLFIYIKHTYICLLFVFHIVIQIVLFFSCLFSHVIITATATKIYATAMLVQPELVLHFRSFICKIHLNRHSYARLNWMQTMQWIPYQLSNHIHDWLVIDSEMARTNQTNAKIIFQHKTAEV